MNVRICKPTRQSWLRQSLFDLWPIACGAAAVVALLTTDGFGAFYRRSPYGLRLAVVALVCFFGIAVCRYSLSMLRMTWEVHSGTVCFDANAIWRTTRFGTPRIPWTTLTSAALRQRRNYLSPTDRMLTLESAAPEFVQTNRQIEPTRFPFVLHTSTLKAVDEAAILLEVSRRCQVVKYEDEPAL